AERRSSGDVDEPVGAKREPGTARAVVPVANEEILDVREGLAVELAARQHDRALALLRVGGADVSGLVVSEVDQPVGRKLRVQRDLMETAGPEGRHLRKAGHRIRVYLGLHTRRTADDAQPHASLAHERITVR